MVFLAIIGVIGLLIALALAVAALFKRIQWKTVGWTAGASVLVIILAAALGGESSPAPGNSGSPGTAPSISNAPPPAPAPAPKAPEKKPDLEVVEIHPENDSFTKYVAGTVKNNTGRKYGYVQVEINLYDESGAQVGSTFANTNNLEPGGTWKFRAVVFEDNAKSFKVTGVSGF